MRIVHICLANFYVDGMGYQENQLPKFHSQNHEVFILTSDFSFDASGNHTKREKKEYINEHGIPVKVLDKSRRYGPYSKFKDFKAVYSTLCELKPDVIFCHGGQFVALKDVIKYCRKNNSVKLYIDQHGDYYNTPVNTLKKKILYKYIYGYWIRKAVPYVEKFWGVTPWRCEYLRDVYGLPEEKIGLLIMGGDDDKIHLDRRDSIRADIRKKHNIADNDLVVVTGGKIDERKNIHLLVDAVKELGFSDLKLIVFGQPSDDFKDTFLSSVENSDAIRYIGWIPSEEAYNYFLASDLAVFPGTHSVLWEQACACGVPGIFRDWEGMHHVDVGGNALFLCQNSKEEIKHLLINLYNDKEKLMYMKSVAQEKAVSAFSYREIAKKAISEDC